MSSRLMPPKVGAMAATAATIWSTVLRVQLDVEHVDVGEPLEEDRLALHDGLGRQRVRGPPARGSPCRWSPPPRGSPGPCSRRRSRGRARFPPRRAQPRACRPGTGRAACRPSSSAPPRSCPGGRWSGSRAHPRCEFAMSPRHFRILYTVPPVRPKTSGWYISSARVGGVG